MQFSDGTFSESYISTIGVDFKIRSATVNGKQVKLQIWDTAGQERFHSITSNYYHGAHGVAVVYDITNRESFEHTKKWVDEVEKIGSLKICKVIVGNKVDIGDKREVSEQEGKDFAETLGVPFIETSAKTSFNVREMFNNLCIAIDDRNDLFREINPDKKKELGEGKSICRYRFCGC
ncbi:GTP-binding protein ypt1 [Histomonas meleagridis]|uniref:GTP-binding protein ypt1 n=1 Tax=Histomonas meleagridis TaxID=135588 RepID=UPI0035598586|nr:GTP-binding protein ypt1 [Histomonas meleagridis]KAH0797459.1 GTP-binding protein ypt1 [Histomonas meleagridis]